MALQRGVLPQQIGQFGDVDGNPASLVFVNTLACIASDWVSRE
jgi:hypothetical protein